MAIKHWPVDGGPPAVPANGLAFWLKLAPDKTAARTSTISPIPNPLYLPAGSNEPCNAACASVVG